MPSPKDELIEAIPVVEYIQRDYPAWTGQESDLLSCPMAFQRHEGDDSTPSLSVKPETGEFNCFGCNWHGTSIIGYATDVHYGGNFKLAIAKLYKEFIGKTIEESVVKDHFKKLRRRPRLLQLITSSRGWTKDTMDAFRIGWCPDRKRTVIPIYNLLGVCVDLRFHDSVYRAPLRRGKRVPMLAVNQTGDWFPVNPAHNPWSHDEVWIVEGEPDAILACQDGLNAVTLTGGAGIWKTVPWERLQGLQGKHVIACMDNDKAGQASLEAIAQRLAGASVASLKLVAVPQGKDISDWFLKYGGSGDYLRQIASLRPYAIKPRKKSTKEIPLSETSQAKFINQIVKTEVLVTGKHHSPQSVPKLILFSCNMADRCDPCPCRETGSEEYLVDYQDDNVIEWLYTKDYSQMIKKEMGLPNKCRMKIEVKEWWQFEAITMIPSLTNRTSQNNHNYVVRQGFYAGHGLESNQTYRVDAMPVVHPRTKESVLLVYACKGTYDSIDHFKLDPDEVRDLKDLFRDDPKTIIEDICRMFSYNVTKIYNRWDLHAAVDLAFHCPRDFSFAGTRLPKGSLEILLFGDTRCGKGQVAEGIVRYYDLGTVVSGENASLMGLAGGASKAGDSFQLTWGAIPLNHGRLVVVDEFSGLGSDILGRLSRIRSEGVAELNKGGIHASTRSNTRLIWIANPKKGREMASFANGVSAIMDMVGTDEDVARFDLALVVQKGEVDVEEINRPHSTIESKYEKDMLRKVVLWVWSRSADHVCFTRDATAFILRASSELALRYSPTIPLLQGENARFKLAKIAAAIAGRCFSTQDGVLLRVTKRHAELAKSFLEYCYKKPSMGYLTYSNVEMSGRKLTNKDELERFFTQWPIHVRMLLVDGLLSVEKFGVRELQDWTDTDAGISKKFAGMLVRSHAVRQLPGGLYVKLPAFINYLKGQKRKMK